MVKSIADVIKTQVRFDSGEKICRGLETKGELALYKPFAKNMYKNHFEIQSIPERQYHLLKKITDSRCTDSNKI